MEESLEVAGARGGPRWQVAVGRSAIDRVDWRGAGGDERRPCPTASETDARTGGSGLAGAWGEIVAVRGPGLKRERPRRRHASVKNVRRGAAIPRRRRQPKGSEAGQVARDQSLEDATVPDAAQAQSRSVDQRLGEVEERAPWRR